MKNVNSFDDLSREELYEMLDIFAKNWLAHDGCWFLSIEEKYDMDMDCPIFHANP